MTPEHPATAAPAAVTRPRFMLRVAGLPVDSVRGLRCPDSRRWADDVLYATERVRADGERLGDLLHDLVGGSEDESLRRTLLALRRDIFNNRLPRPGAADRALALVRGLDGPAGDALTAWLAGRRGLEEQRAAGAALLAAETARARGHLRALAGRNGCARRCCSPPRPWTRSWTATSGPTPPRRRTRSSARSSARSSRTCTARRARRARSPRSPGSPSAPSVKAAARTVRAARTGACGCGSTTRGTAGCG